MRITLYPGQFYDTETGLHYNFQRYYDPRIGRYLTIDPIGFVSGDVNLYGYVENSPIRKVDIYGLSCKDEIQKQKLEYSCRCGWIDWGHLSASNLTAITHGPIWGAQGISGGIGWARSKARPGALIRGGQMMVTGTPLPNTDMIFGGMFVYYFVSDQVLNNEDLQKSVALGIFKHVNHEFETYQGWDIFAPRIRASSFSEDDFPSDIIAFYRAIYPEKYKDDDVIRRICGGVGIDPEGIRISEQVWEAAYGDAFCIPKTNKEWKPVNDYNSYCTLCYESMEWPEEFDEIKAAPPGKLWDEWRPPLDGPIPSEALPSQDMYPGAVFFPGWEWKILTPPELNGAIRPLILPR